MRRFAVLAALAALVGLLVVPAGAQDKGYGAGTLSRAAREERL